MEVVRLKSFEILGFIEISADYTAAIPGPKKSITNFCTILSCLSELSVYASPIFC